MKLGSLWEVESGWFGRLGGSGAGIDKSDGSGEGESS